MDDRLYQVIDSLAVEYRDQIQKGARHYREVNIGLQADKLGYADLKEKYGPYKPQ